jgi:serine/threonine-protein kinase
LSDTYFPLFVDSGGYLLEYAQRYPQEIIAVARLASILWVVLIIAYGTFIPNTGRRCAAVTMGMALSCLSLVTIAGLLRPALPRRLLMLFLADMTLWLGCAVAMAIYGSHKITALRQEALAARKLGQYVLKRRLGVGGMGEVYLAEHVLLKRPCAVKVIRPDEADNPSTLRRFLREVQITATLTHPNTVQVFDYGQTDDGTVFYAMEYLPGLNLEKLVGQYGALPAQRVIYVLQQLCGALAEAHAVGLIHRDIKPSNVILCSRGGLYDVAKLLDFGLVRMQSTDAAAGGATQAGLIFGTPTYMSPEQALGGKLDARSDIYSLGALAWFLALSEPPFVREGVIQTLAAHINEPAPSLRSRSSAFPEDLANIVQRCLAKDPDDRFPNITSLGQALAKCRSAETWTQTEAAAWWSSATTTAQSRPLEPA